MKNTTLSVLTMILLLTCFSTTIKASTTPEPTSSAAAKPIESAQTTALRTRLKEIKSIDKSDMSSSEKRQLRKEGRSIKKQLKAVSGGVYLSAGAIIVVLLLLIILL